MKYYGKKEEKKGNLLCGETIFKAGDHLRKVNTYKWVQPRGHK